MVVGTQRRTAGMHARQKPIRPTIPQTIPTTIVRQTSLSSQLLSLASSVEELENNHTATQQFHSLLSTAMDIVVEAELTYGVIVLTQSTFRKLEDAIKTLKDVTI